MSFYQGEVKYGLAQTKPLLASYWGSQVSYGRALFVDNDMMVQMSWDYRIVLPCTPFASRASLFINSLQVDTLSLLPIIHITLQMQWWKAKAKRVWRRACFAQKKKPKPMIVVGYINTDTIHTYLLLICDRHLTTILLPTYIVHTYIT